MGIPEKEFWKLTFRELHILWKRHLESEKRKRKQKDYRAGTICAVFANCFRNSKKRKKPYKPEDFMPKEGGAKEQTWQKQMTIVEIINEAFGGEDLREKQREERKKKKDKEKGDTD